MEAWGVTQVSRGRFFCPYGPWTYGKVVEPVRTRLGGYPDPFWVILGHFRAFWAPSGLPRRNSACAKQYNGRQQAQAGILGPKLRMQYGLTLGTFLPHRRVPLCSRSRDTEF